MKILCLVLAVLSVTCFSPNQKNSLSEISTFEEKFSQIQQSSLGEVLYSLVQLERQVGTPVEELLLAIEQFLQETSTSKEKEESDFARASGEHNDYKLLLVGNIEQTKFVLESAINKLETILEPKVEQLQDNIAQRNENIEYSMQTFQQEQTMREGETKKYNEDQKNYDLGITISQECIEQMKAHEMTQGAFVQLDKTKLNLHKLQEEVFKEHNEISPMIMALIQLMDGQSFSDSQMEEAMDKLGDLENLIRENKGMAMESEQKKAEMWEERSTELKKEIQDFQNGNDLDQQDLDVVKDNIESETSLINEQKQQLEELEGTLKQEEADFVEQTNVHEELITKYDQDIGLTVEAKQLIIMHKDELNELAKTNA